MSDNEVSEPNYIREWRNHRGLTLDELGEMVGYAKNHISRWERSVRPITLDQLKMVADALDCTVYDLVYCNPEEAIEFFNLWAQLPEDKRAMFTKMVRGLLDQK